MESGLARCKQNPSRSSSNFKGRDYEILRSAIQGQNKDMVLQLVQRGVQLNDPQNPYNCHSPLHLGVISRCPEIVKILLDGGADIGVQDRNQDTPLTFAAKTENRHILNILLSYDVQNHMNRDGLSHLHVACMMNKVSVVRKLILSNNSRNFNQAVLHGSMFWPGYTPLHFAVRYGSIDVVEYLLECGANITAQDYREMTPLHLADLQRDEKIIDLLLAAHQCEFKNPMSCLGMTHFHIACTRDNVSVVEHFLRSGVDIDLQLEVPSRSSWNNSYELAVGRSIWAGWKPIHFAMYYGCSEVVKLLLSAKVQLQVKNKLQGCDFSYLLEQFMKKTAFTNFARLVQECAPDKNRQQFLKMPEFHLACLKDHLTTIKRLSEHEATHISSDFELPIHMGFTPLHLAAKYNSLKAMRVLVAHGANLLVKDHAGETPIHIAFKYGHSEILRLMLDQLTGHTENVTNSEGLSIFHILCTLFRLSDVENFIRAGVDINAQVKYESKRWAGFTALHFACMSQWRSSIVQVLLDNNVDISIKNGINLSPYDQLAESLDLDSQFDQESILICLIMIKRYREYESRHKFNNLHAMSILKIRDIESKRESVSSAKNYINVTTIFPQSRKYDKCTSLHLAMLFENFGQVELLLENGADPFIENRERKTPLEFWFQYKSDLENIPIELESCFMLGTPLQGLKPSHFNIACRLGFLDAVKILLDNVPDERVRMSFVNHRDEDGRTPLHSILKAQYPKSSVTEIVRILLENGADVNARDNEQSTPLHCASRSEHFNDLGILIKHGAQLDAQNIFDETSLHLILSLTLNQMTREKISCLLENGAEIKLFDEYGQTCLSKLKITIAYANNDRRNNIILLLKHIKRLRIIGRRVGNMNLNSAREFSRYLREDGTFDVRIFTQECKKELETMESVNVDRYTTLKAILSKTIQEMAYHCENAHLQELIESENFSQKYPIYGYLVRVQVKHGKVRRSLLIESKSSLTKMIEVKLPQSCFEEIFQYLTNADLVNIISSAEKSN